MDGMTTLDDFAAAFGFDSGSENLWTTLGKVTAIDGGTFSVKLGGSETATDCDAYCSAEVGDIVLVVVSKGRARAVARKGGQLPAETYGQCFFGFFILVSNLRPELWEIGLPGNQDPGNFPNGSLIAVVCNYSSTYQGRLSTFCAAKNGGYVYVNNAETSASNTLTWSQNDVLLFAFYKVSDSENRYYLVSHLAAV